MEAKVVLSGIVTGGFTQILTGNLLTAVLVAIATGSAAYVGQQLTKFLHIKYKKWKRKSE
jgi:hypothetical protein